MFGVDRALADPGYDFGVCGPGRTRIGDWLSVETPSWFEALEQTGTVIVAALDDVTADPPPATPGFRWTRACSTPTKARC